MTELQRRAYHRTAVPPETTLVASLWSGGVAARATAQGSPLQVLMGDLADLSCGGGLIRLHQVTPPKWTEGETVGVELQLPDGRSPVSVDARYRGARHDEHGVLCAAIQFVGLELTVDGRIVLQRLANSVQRLHRMALASGRRDWKPKLKP